MNWQNSQHQHSNKQDCADFHQGVQNHHFIPSLILREHFHILQGSRPPCASIPARRLTWPAGTCRRRSLPCRPCSCSRRRRRACRSCSPGTRTRGWTDSRSCCGIRHGYWKVWKRAISADLQCVSSVLVSCVAPEGGGGSLVVERPTAGHVPWALRTVWHQEIHSPVVLKKGEIRKVLFG